MFCLASRVPSSNVEVHEDDVYAAGDKYIQNVAENVENDDEVDQLIENAEDGDRSDVIWSAIKGFII